MVTSTIRRKKKLYYDSRITDCQSNPKQLWNVGLISQLTGRQQFDNIPAELDLSANDFNEYFSSIGSETVAHLISSADNETASNDTLFWRGSNCISRFAFSDVSIEYVTSQLRALGHSSKNYLLGFDCKLLSTCSDLHNCTNNYKNVEMFCIRLETDEGHANIQGKGQMIKEIIAQ